MAKCGTCPAEIDWALLPSGKRIPVNHDSAGDPSGNLAVIRLGGELHARYLSHGQQPEGGEKRGISHFATCPNADGHRKPRESRRG